MSGLTQTPGEATNSTELRVSVTPRLAVTSGRKPDATTVAVGLTPDYDLNIRSSRVIGS